MVLSDRSGQIRTQELDEEALRIYCILKPTGEGAAALGMSLRKVTSLGSNLESVTDLKRIETPHNLFQ